MLKYPDARKCIVEFCQNTGRNCNLTFFMVPEDNPDKAEKWLKALQLKPNLPKKKFICSDHFEMKCFSNTFRRNLLYSAVPTLQFKSPKEEGTTWDDCRETHFVWDSLNCMTNSESSEDKKPTSEELCIIANLYLASSNSEKSISMGNSSDKSTVLAEQIVSSYAEKSIDRNTIVGQNSIDRKAIEKTIDDYLKKRYLDAEKRKAFEETLKVGVMRCTRPHKKKRPYYEYQDRSKDSQDSIMRMEISNSSVENQSSDEGNSAAETQLSFQQISTCPKQPINFDSVLKQNNINSENITKQLLEKQKLYSSPVRVQSVSNGAVHTDSQRHINSDHSYQMYNPKTNSQNAYSSSCVRSSSIESNQTGAQRHTSSDVTPQVYDPKTNNSIESNQMGVQRCTGPQPLKLVKSGDIYISHDKFLNIFSVESDSEYNEFAATIVQGLKELKTPTSRAKAVYEIQRILLKAKSGVYDILS